MGYIIMGMSLGKLEMEKDLGVIVDYKLKGSLQCQVVVNKVSRVLFCIKKGMYCRDKFIILLFYRLLVRFYLEYAVQFWLLVLRKDVFELEKVQRRVIKLIRGMEDQSYEIRLLNLNMFILEVRRLRGDMIFMYKMFNGGSNISDKLFKINFIIKIRGYYLKLVEKKFQYKGRRGFFIVRLVRVWNLLLQAVILVNNVELFKKFLDDFLRDRNIQGYRYFQNEILIGWI